MTVPTIADRLETISLLCARIEGCLRLLRLGDLERIATGTNTLAAALSDLSDIGGEISWLTHNVPVMVLNTPAPDDSELQKIEAAKGERKDDDGPRLVSDQKLELIGRLALLVHQLEWGSAADSEAKGKLFEACELYLREKKGDA